MPTVIATDQSHIFQTTRITHFVGKLRRECPCFKQNIKITKKFFKNNYMCQNLCSSIQFLHLFLKSSLRHNIHKHICLLVASWMALKFTTYEILKLVARKVSDRYRTLCEPRVVWVCVPEQKPRLLNLYENNHPGDLRWTNLNTTVLGVFKTTVMKPMIRNKRPTALGQH